MQLPYYPVGKEDGEMVDEIIIRELGGIIGLAASEPLVSGMLGFPRQWFIA
jgi:hypothetical protein